MANERAFLTSLFQAAVAAADPGHCVPPALPPPPRGRTLLLAAGKAAAAMARAAETAWPAGAKLSGMALTRYGHAVPCERITVVEASHPVPDAAGQRAAATMRLLADELTADDMLLCLISGGGSALLSLPAPGLTLDDKQAVNRALLRSGAAIDEMNCVRKHLSAIKGGRLAQAAHPAPTVTLAISDVPGDDPSVIASGPTVADATTLADARAVLERYGIDVPHSVRHALTDTANETPKPGDKTLALASHVTVASPYAALQAAAAVARRHGIVPLILGDAIEGEAREVARMHAGIALSCARHGVPALPPCVLLSGGETTVTVRGTGRGGRNAEFLLALAAALNGAPDIHALAADTDGIDGTEDNAGAFLSPDFLTRARAATINPAQRLADNDGYGVFAALGDLLVTGPTRTNVNDFRAILIGSLP